MVGLYIVYVVYVGVGSWWESRRDEKRRKIREAREEYDVANGLGFEVGLEQGESSDEEEERTFGEGGDIEWEPDQGGTYSHTLSLPYSIAHSLSFGFVCSDSTPNFRIYDSSFDPLNLSSLLNRFHRLPLTSLSFCRFPHPTSPLPLSLPFPFNIPHKPLYTPLTPHPTSPNPITRNSELIDLGNSSKEE